MSNTLFFNQLTIRNFLSFGQNETVIDLSNPGTISIEGQNIDQGGSNGSGKTTIINALCYALYNKPFDTISLQRLINSTNSTQNTLMEVRLSFTRGGDEYEIIRTRGEQISISFLKNGEDITPGKSIIECDKLIADAVGVSYDLFSKTIIFSGNSVPFLQLPIAQQRNQIEELFNITLLSEKALLQREKIKETESDLKVQEAIVKQQEVALELHEKHVSDAKNRLSRWEVQRKADILEIERTLSLLSTVDFEKEQLLHDSKNKLIQDQAHLSAKLSPAKKDKNQLSISVEKLLQEQEHLVRAKCPYCLQKFQDADKKILELELDIEAKGAKLLEIDELVSELSAEQALCEQELNEVTQKISYPNLKELLKTRENATVLQSRLNELNTAENPHAEAVDKLINAAQHEVQNDKIDALRKRLDHQAFLLKLLTSKDSFLRQRIISKTIPFLNARINSYTASLGLPHIVKFDADLSCTVSEFGRELDFGNLSAGEKKRVNIGLSLAFRDVLHHLHAKCNLVLIDELDGALDIDGMDNVVKVLKAKSRDEQLSVFVISHHQAIAGRLDRNMIIRKENGFSTIYF